MGETVADMTALEHLDEGSMLKNLNDRLLKESNPYTYVSTVLVAVNPLKRIPNPEDTKFVEQAFDPNLPHPNALAELAFQRLCGVDANDQSIVVSGESGAGKTESSKIVVQYLTRRAKVGTANNGMTDLAGRIVALSPVLEAFGNASTHRNPNSSRFGRFVKMVFASTGPASIKLIGGELETYLLEKSRVVRQNAGERNFHSMHMLLKQRKDIQLEQKASYRCVPSDETCRTVTAASGHQSIPEYKAVTQALEAVGVDTETATSVWIALGAVVSMADIIINESVDEQSQEFAADIETKEGPAYICAQLLDLPAGADGLVHSLTKRLVRTRDEGEIEVRRTPHQVRTARDAACRWLYGAVFEALVRQCNTALIGNSTNTNLTTPGSNGSYTQPKEVMTGTTRFIGILDIFGFEILDGENLLETLLINYANEALQQLFCDAVFAAELNLYESEGIMDDDDTLRKIDKPDSTPTIEFLVGSRRSPGVIKVLDAQCQIGGVTESSGKERASTRRRSSSAAAQSSRDAAFLAKIHTDFARHASLGPTGPLDKRHMFHVRHYAGIVGYTVVGRDDDHDIDDGWVATNLDTIPDGIPSLIHSSKNAFIASLGANAESIALDTTMTPTSVSPNPSSSQTTPLTGERSPPRPKSMANKTNTVCSRFAASMSRLATTLQVTDCGFIRCIKPTPRMIPNVFDIDYVREQLRALGVVAATEVLRVGLPHRVEYEELVNHTIPASARSGFEGEPNDVVVACILSAFDVSADDYRLGNTRVFFPASALGRINAALAFDENADPDRAKQLAIKLDQAKKQAKEAGHAVADLKIYASKAKEILIKARASISQVPFVDIDEAAAAISANTNSSQTLSSVESLIHRASSEVETAHQEAHCEFGSDESKELAAEADIKLKEAQVLVKEAAAAEGELGGAKSTVETAKTEADTARSIVASCEMHATAAERASTKAAQAARKLQIAQAQEMAQEAKAEANQAENIYTTQDPERHARAATIAWESLPEATLDTAALLSREKCQAAEVEAQAALSAAKKSQDIVAKARAVAEEEAERVRKEEEEARRLAEEEAARIEAEARAAEEARLAAEGDRDEEEEEDNASATTAVVATSTGAQPSSTPKSGPAPSNTTTAVSPVRLDDNAAPGERMASRLRKLKRWFVLEPAWEERSKPKVINPRNFTASATSTRSLVSRKSSNASTSNETQNSGGGAAAAGSLRDMIYRGINISPLDGMPDDPRLPMLHCIVKRKAVGMMSSYQFELYLSAEPTKLVLAARRPTSGSPGYAIYDNASGAVASSSPSSSRAALPKRIVAKLRESTMNSEDQAAAKTAPPSNSRELATFGQERPNGSMPREICVLLAPSDEDTNKRSDGSPVPQALNAHVASADQIDPKIPVFVQRDPVIRDGMYLLNFRGRGRVASGKNFQLVAAAPDFCRDSIDHANDEAVVLQFCKVSANRFHLDFCAPFTPLAAFALAVSICLG